MFLFAACVITNVVARMWARDRADWIRIRQVCRRSLRKAERDHKLSREVANALSEKWDRLLAGTDSRNPPEEKTPSESAD